MCTLPHTISPAPFTKRTYFIIMSNVPMVPGVYPLFGEGWEGSSFPIYSAFHKVGRFLYRK